MTVLSTEAIKERLSEKDLSRLLVVRPLLEPESQCKLGQGAIDIRLGFEFCLVTASEFGEIDEFSPVTGESFAPLYRREYVPFGESIIIHPQHFLLAQSLEYLRLPPDLMAYVVGRSTWGRLGLIVATAIGVHPGFSGNLTLELRNLGETPLVLYPGQVLAQLFVHSVVGKDGAPHTQITKDVQYAGTTDMVPRKLSSSLTHEVLRKMRERSRRL